MTDTNNAETFEVAYSQGTHPVTIGSTVWLQGVEWRIGDVDGFTYSPSSIGGVQSFRCYPVTGAVPDKLARYAEDDGSVVFCGDTIAAQLARGNPKEF